MTENKEIKKKVFDELNDICSECKKEHKSVNYRESPYFSMIFRDPPKSNSFGVTPSSCIHF